MTIMNASLPNNAGFFYVPQGYNDAPMFSRNTIQPSSFYSHAPMFASASFAPMYTHASGGASSLQIVSPVIPVYAPSAIHVCAPVCSGFSAQAHLATPEFDESAFPFRNMLQDVHNSSSMVSNIHMTPTPLQTNDIVSK
ncbi:hypothetical protein V6N11_043108 [Hibiscus sabdariffa]|uniref:Uncharacterized protein n=1 Tax=Hibiscus sabdariffa TaxID=183260 RepID=A0ABR2QYB3_9ROSI